MSWSVWSFSLCHGRGFLATNIIGSRTTSQAQIQVPQGHTVPGQQVRGARVSSGGHWAESNCYKERGRKWGGSESTMYSNPGSNFHMHVGRLGSSWVHSDSVIPGWALILHFILKDLIYWGEGTSACQREHKQGRGRRRLLTEQGA